MHYNRFKHTQKKKYLKEPKWSICALSINLQCYCYHCSQGCQILGAITTFIVCIHIFTFNQRFKYVLTQHEIFLERFKNIFFISETVSFVENDWIKYNFKYVILYTDKTFPPAGYFVNVSINAIFLKKYNSQYIFQYCFKLLFTCAWK